MSENDIKHLISSKSSIYITKKRTILLKLKGKEIVSQGKLYIKKE